MVVSIYIYNQKKKNSFYKLYTITKARDRCLKFKKNTYLHMHLKTLKYTVKYMHF